MDCKDCRDLLEIMEIRETSDPQDNRENQEKLAQEDLPEEMARQDLRECWEWLDLGGHPEMTENMVRLVLQDLLDRLDHQVMESVTTQLLWRHCLVTVRSTT